MGHGMEEDDYMFAVGGGQWHDIGAKIDRAPSIEEGIRAAKLDWTVSLRALYTAASPTQLAEIAGHRAIVRDSDNKPLGICGTKYKPLQNVEAFRWFDPVLETQEMELDTAGSLLGGTRVWVLAKWKKDIEVVRGDKISPYVLLSNNHDGTGSVRGKPTAVRVVCKNTLGMALGDGIDGIRVRHTANMQDRLATAQVMLTDIANNFRLQQKAFQEFAGVSCEGQSLKDYLYAVMPDNAEAKSHTRTENIRGQMEHHAVSGKGTEIPGVRGSLWAAYNGVTAYATHDRNSGKSADDRAESLWFGSGLDLNKAAFEKAREFVKVLR